MTTKVKAEAANDRARRLWDGDAHSTAQALLKELMDDPSPQEAILVLLPWITDRVRAAIRTDVRAAEESAFTNPSGRPDRVAQHIRSQSGALPALDNLEMLLSLPVLVPVAGSVTQSVLWKDMTIADHQARIGMISKPLAAINAAISRHRWSIAEIKKHKVECLGQIDLAVLRAEMLSSRA
jgi:hypothetical protein